MGVLAGLANTRWVLSAVVTVFTSHCVPLNNPRSTAPWDTRMASSSHPCRLMIATTTLTPTGARRSAPEARSYDVLTSARCGYQSP